MTVLTAGRAAWPLRAPEGPGSFRAGAFGGWVARVVAGKGLAVEQPTGVDRFERRRGLGGHPAARPGHRRRRPLMDRLSAAGGASLRVDLVSASEGWGVTLGGRLFATRDAGRSLTQVP
ncbi:MAG: hypothetical protein M0Z27_12255 [Thermaerobacter sp.]|nr:hypothetical protein [Thermaerobacter sp.]